MSTVPEMPDLGHGADALMERLCVRAATVDELLTNAYVPIQAQKVDSDRAALRLAAWCRASASGDWRLFAQRLARDGWTFEQVLERFAAVACSSEAPMPVWVSDARWILDCMFRAPTTASPESLRGDQPQPFEHLLFEVAAEAARRAVVGLPHTTEAILATPAREQSLATLLPQLTDLSAPAFFSHFQAWRSRTENSPAQVAAKPTRSVTEAGEYERFLEYMRSEGLAEFFDTKPVLLRLMAVVTRHWIDVTSEFIRRLVSDHDSVCTVLCGLAVPRRVVRVESTLSDHHNRGRSVLLVTLDGGLQVLYKPKDLGIDEDWVALIAMLHEHGAPITLRAPRVLPRNGYGWVEFIPWRSCNSEDELRNFHRRAGAWLALFHVFAAADVHRENLIASGSHPVPIDLEMLLQPKERRQAAGIAALAAWNAAADRVEDSVIATGLLPSYSRTVRNRVVNLGGLGHSQSEDSELVWDAVNTSAMRPVRRKREGSPAPNVPELNGVPASVESFRGEVLDGFMEYSQFLLTNKSRVRDSDLVERMRGRVVRFVLRPTRFYALLLKRARDHEFMSDGVRWSAQLDFVSRLAEWSETEETLWPLYRGERSALADLNVPLFLTRTDSLLIWDIYGNEARLLGEPGLDRALGRLRDLDAGRVEWQLEVVRNALGARHASTVESRERAAAQVEDGESAGELASDSQFLKCVESIAATLAAQAIKRGDSAAWLGLDWLGDSDVARLAPLGFDLYNGAPGIGLFLAAVSRATGNSSYADLAHASVSALRHHLRASGARRFVRRLGVGGAFGLGSIIYSLAVMAELLESEQVLDDASHAARLCDEDLIRADRAFDIMGGCSGGILGLLRLHRTTSDREVLARAIRCGEHLLEHRLQDVVNRGGGWPTEICAWPLAGMSHGAAGFGLALDALHAVTGREDFRSAAAESVGFEDSLYSEKDGGWPDRRAGVEPEKLAWPCQWCHGAGGIGLARLGMLSRGDANRDALKTDVLNAVELVRKAWPDSVETLCCGALGNIELLNEAGLAFEIPGLRTEARRRLAAVLAKGEDAESLRSGVWGGQRKLGLFRGIAGRGYTALRQVAPGVPNVLIWE